MNEEQAKQALNERLRGMRCQTPVETMAILNIIWQAACEWRDSHVGEPVAWQFFCENEKKWFNGSELHNHRKNTEQAGYKLRNLYTTPPAAQINQQLVRALELAETEMRYAGYSTPVADNSGLKNAYEAVVAALAATQMRGDA